jgi:hypothetical protein
VTEVHITLLAEDLTGLAHAADAAQRYPALERVLAKGKRYRIKSKTANHLRFALFGVEPGKALPVAAMTHVSDRKMARRGDYYWLRTDPVTLWADMARVFMTSHGFADLDPYERNEIENCIRQALLEEGIDIETHHPERWCIPLKKPLKFEFTPLDEALGMDQADALPDHPESLYWRRVLNDIQVALHHCPVNVRRRQEGRQQINSVWFWGGGFIPDSSPGNLVDTVYSDHPVTRGLAIINDCRLKALKRASSDDLDRDGRSVLIDWIPATRFAHEELDLLEILVRHLLTRVEAGGMVLTLLDGSGRGCVFDRGARRRFWRRTSRLSALLGGSSGT